jgi:hypothetical protein
VPTRSALLRQMPRKASAVSSDEFDAGVRERTRATVNAMGAETTGVHEFLIMQNPVAPTPVPKHVSVDLKYQPTLTVKQRTLRSFLDLAGANHESPLSASDDGRVVRHDDKRQPLLSPESLQQVHNSITRILVEVSRRACQLPWPSLARQSLRAVSKSRNGGSNESISNRARTAFNARIRSPGVLVAQWRS